MISFFTWNDRATRRGLLACLAASSAVMFLPAPSPADDRLFEKYAPLVWLASDERIYPMMPHPFAFDGLDNDLDGFTDLEDPKEILMDRRNLDGLVDLVEHLRGFEFTVDMEAAELESLSLAESYAKGPREQTGERQLDVAQSGDMEKSRKTAPRFSLPEGRATPWLRNAFNSFGQPLPGLTCVHRDTVSAHPRLASLDASWWSRLGAGLRDTAWAPELRQVLKGKRVPLFDAPLDLRLNLRMCRGESLFVLAQPHPELGRDVRFYLDRRLDAEGRLSGVDVYGAAHYQYTVRYDHADPRFATIAHESRLPPPRVTYALSADGIKGRTIYEYWFYYLFDVGANGHAHDGEHVFIYLDDLKRVNAVVGTGHTDATPNNILVSSNTPRKSRILPGSLPRHMPILVELGKHASAPDRAFDGQFDLGMDANMFYKDVWGSRDIAAASGVNQIRRVSPEFSFPRDQSTLIVERSWRKEALDPDSRGKDLEPVDLAIMSGYKSVRSQFPGGCETYALFPMETMEELFARLDDPAVTRADVQAFIDENRATLRGVLPRDAMDVEFVLTEDGFAAMRSWPKNTEPNRELWMHKDHIDPSETFKLWLFPRTSFAVSTLLQGGDGYLRTSVYRSDFFGLFSNSTVELYADFDIDERGVAFLFEDVGLNYRLFRGSHQGLYAGFGRGGGLHRRGFPYLTLGYVPFSWDMQALPVVPIPDWMGHGQISVFAEARGELDTARQPWALDPFRAKIGLTLGRRIQGAFHPLDF